MYVPPPKALHVVSSGHSLLNWHSSPSGTLEVHAAGNVPQGHSLADTAIRQRPHVDQPASQLAQSSGGDGGREGGDGRRGGGGSEGGAGEKGGSGSGGVGGDGGAESSQM